MYLPHISLIYQDTLLLAQHLSPSDPKVLPDQSFDNDKPKPPLVHNLASSPSTQLPPRESQNLSRRPRHFSIGNPNIDDLTDTNGFGKAT